MLAGVFSLVFSGLFTLAILAAIIYLIIKGNRKQEVAKKKGNKNLLLHIYLYLISFATLIIAVVGITISLNALFSYKISIPFSYSVNQLAYDPKDEFSGMTESTERCYQGEITNILGQNACFDENKQKKSIITGLTLTISMLILFALHRIAIKFAEKKDIIIWLKKLYNFASLIIYSVVSIIATPISIYLTITYAYFRPEDITQIEAPGSAIALAIVSIPLWIIFLIATLKLRDKEEKEK